MATFQPGQPSQPHPPSAADADRGGALSSPGGNDRQLVEAVTVSPLASAESSDSTGGQALPQKARLPLISVRGLVKTYLLGQTRVRALRSVSLDIMPGEFVAIMGPSGSGKSTFMNLLGCLDRPTSGTYWLMGTSVGKMTPDQLAEVRNQKIGFVFQGFNLLSRSSALENTVMPMLYAGKSKQEQLRRARRVLQLVGLSSRANHKPAQLSGGQQQRVAIARALVNSPALLLADEPTGNLDTRTSIEIMAVLQALNDYGLTIVLVTHEPDIAAFATRQIAFRDGRVVRDEATPQVRRARAELEVTADSLAGGAENVRIREERG